MSIKAYIWYKYNPTLGDAALVKGFTKGQLVRVIKPSDLGVKHAATTFGGHVYITDVYGQNPNMVFTNSLEPIGTHGTFVMNDKSYHYEQESKNRWIAWEDGKADAISQGTTFANLFDML